MYFAVWLSLVSISANADFQSAMSAYEQQDYATAFQEFKRLSELGDAPSQRNLAVMYFKGQHVAPSAVEAYAWASLSNQAGGEENARIFHAIAKNLSDAVKPQAEQRFQALQAQFGTAALQQRLMPIVEQRQADCSVEASGDAVPREISPPRYPIGAAIDNVEGFACVSFYLSKSGFPKNLKVIESDAFLAGNRESKQQKSTFEKVTLEAIRKWTFLPAADETLRENKRSYCLDYKLEKFSRKEVAQIQKDVKLAAEEDQNAKVLFRLSNHYKEIASHLKDNGKEEYVDYEKDANTLKLRSAVYGNADAQYSVASDLLTGNQCTKDEQKGIIWLTFAAQQGHAQSQYLLANHLMSGESVKPQPEKAMQWYKLAAENGHNAARMMYLTYALEQESVDVSTLETLLPKDFDPTDMQQLEVAALLAARKDDYAEALRRQTQVLEIAEELEFETEQRKLRLQRYQQMQQRTSLLQQ